MNKVLFDTDILIEYLRGNEAVVDSLESLLGSKKTLAITPITQAEIFQGLRPHEKKQTEKILNALDCLPLTREIGQKAGDYLREYRKTHGIDFADAFIAATASLNHFALCTFNWKHYPMQEIRQYRL